MLSRMDDPQMRQLQTLKGLMHRLGYFRGFTEFAFDPISTAVKNEQEIYFRPAVCGPEISLGRPDRLKNLVDSEAFPRRTYPRIAVKRLNIWDVEQAVKKTRIPKINLRRFDLALADVLVPRLKLPDHKGSRENVEIGPHRFVREIEGTAKFGGIPCLAVVMGEHRPETTHGRRRNRDAELWDISGQEGLNEVVAPRQTVFIGRSEKRTREPAPEPENVGTTRSRLVNIETGKLDEFDSTGQGFGNVLDQVGRGAPQNKESSFVVRTVGQHAQHAEQLGHCMNFINDHEATQRGEHEMGILQAVQIDLGFEVEIDSSSVFPKLAGESRFPALPWTNEGRNRGAFYSAGYLLQVAGAINHGLNLSLKNRSINPRFQGKIKAQRSEDEVRSGG